MERLLVRAPCLQDLAHELIHGPVVVLVGQVRTGEQDRLLPAGAMEITGQRELALLPQPCQLAPGTVLLERQVQKAKHLLAEIAETARVQQADVFALHPEELLDLLLGLEFRQAAALRVGLEVQEQPFQVAPGNQAGAARLVDVEGHRHEQRSGLALAEPDVRRTRLDPLGQQHPDGAGVQFDAPARQAHLAPVDQGDQGHEQGVGRQAAHPGQAVDALDEGLCVLTGRVGQVAGGPDGVVPAAGELLDIAIVKRRQREVGKAVVAARQLGVAVADDARGDHHAAVAAVTGQFVDALADVAALPHVEDFIEAVQQEQAPPLLRLGGQQGRGQRQLARAGCDRSVVHEADLLLPGTELLILAQADVHRQQVAAGRGRQPGLAHGGGPGQVTEERGLARPGVAEHDDACLLQGLRHFHALLMGLVIAQKVRRKYNHA